MKEYFEKNKLRLSLMALLLILGVARVFTEKKPYPEGDAISYTLMTEAFYNHYTPEVRVSDCESFKQAYSKKNRWENNDKAVNYDSVENFIAQKDLSPLDSRYAFFVDKNGHKYSAYFWFYSLVNLPVRWVCAARPFNPILVFHITNLLLIVITCFVFLSTSKFSVGDAGIFSLLFFYSSNYWYFCWPHPEVFTVCFVALGLWMAAHEKWYTAIFLTAMASLQSQPLVLLVLALCLITLSRKGWTLKHAGKAALSACIVLLPSVFYLFHFGTPDLIAYQGALQLKYISFTRIRGFFFDLNQGMILALPLVLLLYLYFYFRKLYRIKTAETKWDLWLFPVMILIVCTLSAIDNWNHGQAIVNRYVTFVGAIVLLHFFLLVTEFQTTKTIKYRIFGAALFAQVLTVLYHQKFNHYDWSTNKPKPLSNWVLAHFPSFYNPDPVIFNTRYGQGLEMDPAVSPTYFIKSDGEITKFLVHRDYLANLEAYGFSNDQVDSIAPHLHYHNDWAYITVSDKFRPGLSNEELKEMDEDRRVEEEIKVIRETPAWYLFVKKKAQEQGVDEETALRYDAAYTLRIQLPPRPKTIKEKIHDKIEEIKADPTLLHDAKLKAEAEKISVDSALQMQARAMVQ